MTWFGAAVFLTGLLFFVLGMEERRYGGTGTPIPVLLGAMLVSTSLLIWTAAMAAAAIRWRAGKSD